MVKLFRRFNLNYLNLTGQLHFLFATKKSLRILFYGNFDLNRDLNLIVFYLFDSMFTKNLEIKRKILIKKLYLRIRKKYMHINYYENKGPTF